MFITFVLPTILTKELLYTYRDSRDVVRIYVGYTSDNKNNESVWDIRKWFLRDRRGNTVQSGEVAVKLTTFEGYQELTGLTPGEIYTFTIENPGALDTTTVISGIDPTIITLIDETHVFTGNPITIGDIACVLIDPNSSPISARQARLTPTWPIVRAQGNGLIFSGGKIYAYAPTAYYTRKRSASSYIDFTPFAGLPTKRIPIYQLPTIQSEGNFRYSINPASRVVATWINIDSSAGDASKTTQTFDSINPVALLDLYTITSGIIDKISIRAVFV